MSSAPVSAHGFVGVRGRGYRPEQVDRTVAALSAERDGAREREAQLTALAERLVAESARLDEAVAALAPQDYASLGERAQQILALAEGEAEVVRAAAAEESQALRDEVDAAARILRESARADAEAMRAAATAHAERVLSAAEGAAGEELAAARQEAARAREEAGAAMAATVSRTDSVLAHQAQEHGERWKALGEELEGAAAAQSAEHAELTERAEAGLAAARRARAEAEEAARHGHEDAVARGAELIAGARVREERVVRETERILREHAEGREDVQAHMAHVRNSLAALTGRVAPSED
ncbi:cellulose-binding protein [Streptomyces sp. NPDC048332]|uniref:cellulose-binding protein n=1 Tax=unclassified Streptomyces TaxID=2593676 RepID=UPI003443E0F5